jgi:EmrB/QacA subfamily drug resistance transporter
MNVLTVKRYLPWVVAMALFMEQLDSTIVNIAIPSIAASFDVPPLSLKAVVASYILSLAVCIPVSGWMADRFGTRKIFAWAVGLFTLSSIFCGLSINVSMLVAGRVLQGMAAAMMVPVGRLSVIRTFPKSELLPAMNFVIIPALIGPLLGPSVGGLIVHWFSWRDIFFVNVPIGLAAQWMIHRHMPDYKSDSKRPLDVIGLALFGTGSALLSWLLEIFGEHRMHPISTGTLFVVVIGLYVTYGIRATHVAHPLLDLALFKVRTFRISVIGGSVTRLGLGGMPFLLPLLYQLSLGFPAWKSGLLMMPLAVGAIGMKLIASSVLARYGYRNVLMVNTLMIGLTISLFSFIDVGTPMLLILLLSLAQGGFNSLQFSSMNSMAYADIDARSSSMASTTASSMQQLSMSFGLASASLLTAFYIGDALQSQPGAIDRALRYTFTSLGIFTMLSSVSFWLLRPGDGSAVSLSAVKTR